MISNIFAFIIDIVTGFISRMIGFILTPIFNFLVEYNIIDTNYFETFNSFLNDFLFKYIKFARDVIINVTGLPVGIFIFFGTFLTFCLLYFLATLVVRFVFNAIGLARFGKASISLGKGK